MKKSSLILFSTLALFLLSSFSSSPEWGFFGHRRINRMACFTLPIDMAKYYKQNVEYITEHAVDPDKRRYATKHEAVRHYIDIDHWGEYPFDEVPRNFTDALVKYTDLFLVTTSNDTIQIFGNEMMTIENDFITLTSKRNKALFNADNPSIKYEIYRDFFAKNIEPLYYEDDWKVEGENLESFLKEVGVTKKVASAYGIDKFSKDGILPYNLYQYYYKLVNAFESQDSKRILRISAEIGHYIGDASVPLHTTVNYNGQLTDQVGIHAFWESRCPELFADENYDFFVGRAEYIDDINSYIWDFVLESHSYVDDVLRIEKELSKLYPSDKQWCYEPRGEATIRTQCKDYAKEYHEELDGMVEKRMRDAISAIGSFWFSAWVDAGQPDLNNLNPLSFTEEEKRLQEEEEKFFREGLIKGRNHDN